MQEYTSDQLKSIELDVLTAVHDYCVEQNIRYCLWGGSLLGSIRHNGFIPWDDDIDICMPRKDYEAFTAAFSSGPYRCKSFATDPEYPFVFAKAYDDRTVKIEGASFGDRFSIGVDVDIFPIDSVEKNAVESAIFKRIARKRAALRRRYISSVVLPDPNRRGPRQWAKRVLSVLYSGKSCGYARDINRLAVSFNDDGSGPRYDMLFADTNPKNAVLLNTGMFDGRVLHTFEDRSFYIPRDYDYVLTTLYGDYMTPPPPEKQVAHHGFVAFPKETET